DRMFFQFVAKVHPKYHTPHVAIWINIVLAVVFVLFLRFEQLADAFITAIVPFYALSVGSLFVLRRRSGYSPAFRTPGYPLVPALFVISTIYLLGNGLINPESRTLTATALGMILLGIPVYYATVGRNQGASAVEKGGVGAVGG